MREATPRVKLILTPILKLMIAIVGLLLLQGVVSVLPMIREIPTPTGLPLPILAIVDVVIATVILVLLVNFAFESGDNLEIAFPAFPQGGVIVKWFILLVAALLAYKAYRILAETFLRTYTWVYALVFLGLALLPMIRLVLLIYQNIDRLIDIAVTGVRTVGIGGGATPAKGQLQCANCGIVLQSGVKFCRSCGTSVPTKLTMEASPALCSHCGAALSVSSKLCPECGTQTSSA